MKVLTKVFDWIGSWYSEKVAWVICILNFFILLAFSFSHKR